MKFARLAVAAGAKQCQGTNLSVPVLHALVVGLRRAGHVPRELWQHLALCTGCRLSLMGSFKTHRDLHCWLLDL